MMNRRDFFRRLLGGAAGAGLASGSFLAGLRGLFLRTGATADPLVSAVRRDLAASFVVIGLGGAGCNIATLLARQDLPDMRIVAVNTDGPALERAAAHEKLLIGRTLLHGRGVAGGPRAAKQAALQDLERIAPLLTGADTVVVVAGLGGGTGSGAAWPIVRLARSMGAFAPVVATRPFAFEGDRRQGNAEETIGILEQNSNAVIVIPNDGLARLSGERLTALEAFSASDRMVMHAVQILHDAWRDNVSGVTRDDLERLFSAGCGRVVMGVGSGSGEERGALAGLNAARSPLLDRASIRDSRSVYVHVEGGEDLTTGDMQEALQEVAATAGRNAQVLFGVSKDRRLDGSVAVTVLAGGFPHRTMHPTAWRMKDRRV